MINLSEGSIPKHIISLAVPAMFGMAMHTLFLMVDLYFVARIGDAAIAAVGIISNTTLFVIGLSQMLSVGVTALVAQAAGRGDPEDANLTLNQGLQLGAVLTLITFAVLLSGVPILIDAISANRETAEAGKTYLLWLLPHLCVMFVVQTMAAALRGLGLVKVPTLLQMVSVLVNIVLTPILIEGYLTGRPLGIIGAGLSTSIASLVGLVLLLLYFQKQKGSLNPAPHRFHWDPQRWRRILAIGFPAGAEMLMIVAHGSMILWTIAHYGSDAQAGFNIASRINQFFILPALALCHAAPAIVGQNKGSGHPERIRETFRWLSAMAMIVMLSMGAISYIEADALVSIFTDLAEAKAVAVGYIRIAVTSYFALALIYASASIFQGYGNAWPPLFAAIVRSIALVIGLGWFTYSGQYTLSDVWWLNVTANLVQAAVALVSIAWLFRTQLRPRLDRPS